jgi:hypothetical protein
MPHLWEVKHPYYCNDGNYFAHEQPVTEYGSWAEFFESEGDSDFDMNLLFRWDWRKADPEGNEWGNEKETLLLFWMGQRKGLYRWTEVHVTEADEPAVRAWLETRWQYLKRLWTPLSETEPATV